MSIHDGKMQFLRTAARFVNCSALRNGGGFYFGDGLLQWVGGSLHFAGCHAAHLGGALYGVETNLSMQDIDVQVTSCSAGNVGGGLYLEEGALQHKGEKPLFFRRCQAPLGAAFQARLGALLTEVGQSQNEIHCLLAIFR